MARFVSVVSIASAASPASAAPLPRHDIPSDIAIHAFVKPEGRVLRVVLRAPLRAMRDIPFPLKGPGYLDLERADAELRRAGNQWIGDFLEVYEGDSRLTDGRLVVARVSIPSDRSFGRYETAVAHVTGPPVPRRTELYAQQAMLDVMFEYPITSSRSDFSVHPQLERLALRVVTVLRFITPDGAERAYEYTGNPGLIRLDPRWHQAALRFTALGFSHILDGIDHLLFLLCLVIPFRRIRPLVAIVTAFTVAHSATLIASAAGMAPDGMWFPPLVEVLIAASIVYMAIENIVGARIERRWMIAFGFGLVHGFGFSFALSQNLQFAGSHLATSLLAFNVGVELGQLVVLGFLIPALALLFRFVVKERMGTIILSAFVAHTGWHWMTDRVSVLRQYDLPGWDIALIGSVMRWFALGFAVFGVGWLVWTRLRPWSQRAVPGEPTFGLEK